MTSECQSTYEKKRSKNVNQKRRIIKPKLFSIYSHTAKGGERRQKKISDKWGEVVDVQNSWKKKVRKIISQKKNEYNYSRRDIKKRGGTW
jgi:hypothetical protein